MNPRDPLVSALTASEPVTAHPPHRVRTVAASLLSALKAFWDSLLDLPTEMWERAEFGSVVNVSLNVLKESNEFTKNGDKASELEWYTLSELPLNELFVGKDVEEGMERLRRAVDKARLTSEYAFLHTLSPKDLALLNNFILNQLSSKYGGAGCVAHSSHYYKCPHTHKVPRGPSQPDLTACHDAQTPVPFNSTPPRSTSSRRSITGSD